MARPIDAGKTGFCMTGQDLFGRYARIAYGHALNGKQDYHIYKCIQRFKSNCYCDTPLTYQTENNCYNHEDVTDVVNVIHCGIDESCVIRVALKDIELLPTLSPDDLPPVGDWVEDRTEIYCPACGQRFTDEVMCCDIYGWPWLFCPKCGNRIGRSVDNDCN